MAWSRKYFDVDVSVCKLKWRIHNYRYYHPQIAKRRLALFGEDYLFRVWDRELRRFLRWADGIGDWDITGAV